jgi:hypothetical protein
MLAITNHLIDITPHNEIKSLLSVCDSVELELSEVLADSATITRHVYFPTGSFLSLFTSIDDLPCLKSAWWVAKACLGRRSC